MASSSAIAVLVTTAEANVEAHAVAEADLTVTAAASACAGLLIKACVSAEATATSTITAYAEVDELVKQIAVVYERLNAGDAVTEAEMLEDLSYNTSHVWDTVTDSITVEEVDWDQVSLAYQLAANDYDSARNATADYDEVCKQALDVAAVEAEQTDIALDTTQTAVFCVNGQIVTV